MTEADDRLDIDLSDLSGHAIWCSEHGRMHATLAVDAAAAVGRREAAARAAVEAALAEAQQENERLRTKLRELGEDLRSASERALLNSEALAPTKDGGQQ